MSFSKLSWGKSVTEEIPSAFPDLPPSDQWHHARMISRIHCIIATVASKLWSANANDLRFEWLGSTDRGLPRRKPSRLLTLSSGGAFFEISARFSLSRCPDGDASLAVNYLLRDTPSRGFFQRERRGWGGERKKQERKSTLLGSFIFRGNCLHTNCLPRRFRAFRVETLKAISRRRR